MAVAWAVNECRHFLLGLDKFTLAVDHKRIAPLLENKPVRATQP